MPRLSIFSLTLLLSAPLFGAAPEFPGTDDKWQHIASPNFELYSRNGERESRELLHNLELLRAVFFDSFKLTERRRLEVTVYYFKSAMDFRTYASEVYGPQHKFTGFYVPGVDRAVIYLIPGEDAESSRRLIFHEYVHHLVRVSEKTPPTWFNEGMAEMYSTVEPKAGKIEFGQPAVGRLRQLQIENFMPLEQLFTVDHNSPIFRAGEHTGLFYSESWAVLHYLYFGDSKIPPAKRQAFVNLVMANRFTDAAQMRAEFRDVLGMDYPELQTRLQRYVEGGKYYSRKDPLPDIPPGASYAVRAVPESEIRLRLAELALRVNRSAKAKLALLQAMGQDPKDTRPLEVLGADALRDKDEQTAQDRWGRAAEAGTRNPAIYRELGLMESRAWFSRFDVLFRLPEENTRRLRDYLLRSIEYNPEQTDAYEMLAWVEAFAPEPSIRNLTMIQREYPNFTRKERAALALAFVRVRLGQKEDALEMLRQIETLQPDAWVTYGIEATRAHIEGRPIKRENLRPTGPSDPSRIQIQPVRIKVPIKRGG